MMVFAPRVFDADGLVTASLVAFVTLSLRLDVGSQSGQVLYFIISSGGCAIEQLRTAVLKITATRRSSTRW
jgi:hypothetical protein